METQQTLTNAQLLSITELTKKMSNLSNTAFDDIILEDLLTNIIDPIATSRSLKGDDSIRQLKELVVDDFMATSSTLKLVVYVVNLLLLLTIYGQDVSNSNPLQDIMARITENIFKTISI